MIIGKYSKFIILEKFDDNLKSELKRLGVEESEMDNLVKISHSGNLGKYLKENGKKFNFGLLLAIFLDAQDAKSKTELRIGILKALHRIIPMALAPFFPILSIIGYILGTSRAFNKVIAPILADPGNDYPIFLNKLITSTMKIAEGEIIPTKDRFSRAFVVSDNLILAIKEDVLRDFALYLSNKMALEDSDKDVPDFYVENNLKSYLNKRFDIEPNIPLKK
jgi:hypothetical protein